MVGVAGFEPATSWSRTKRASQTALHPDTITYRSLSVAAPELFTETAKEDTPYQI